MSLYRIGLSGRIRIGTLGSVAGICDFRLHSLVGLHDEYDEFRRRGADAVWMIEVESRNKIEESRKSTPTCLVVSFGEESAFHMYNLKALEPVTGTQQIRPPSF